MMRGGRVRFNHNREPPLIYIVERYLAEHSNMSYINMSDMIAFIRARYHRFQRLPAKAFENQVRSAYYDYCKRQQQRQSAPPFQNNNNTVHSRNENDDSDIEEIQDDGNAGRSISNFKEISSSSASAHIPSPPEVSTTTRPVPPLPARASVSNATPKDPQTNAQGGQDSDNDLQIIVDFQQEGNSKRSFNTPAQFESTFRPATGPMTNRLGVGPITKRPPIYGNPVPYSPDSRGIKRKPEENVTSPMKRAKRDFAFVKETGYKLSDFAGNEKVVEEVCKLLMHLKHPEVYKTLGVSAPRGFLLHGPPGTGKTLLANAIAGELNIPMLKVAGTEFISGVSGESESNIRDLFNQAVAIAPCIIFVDEIDSVTQKRQNAVRDMERRIVAQFLSCIDELNNHEKGHQVLLIGATNRVESIDAGLRRAGRFDKEICLGIPDEKSREQILRVLCANLKLAPGFDFKELAKLTPGYVGADLQALIREAAVHAVSEILSKKHVEEIENQQSAEVGTMDKEVHPVLSPTDENIPGTVPVPAPMEVSSTSDDTSVRKENAKILVSETVVEDTTKVQSETNEDKCDNLENNNSQSDNTQKPAEDQDDVMLIEAVSKEPMNEKIDVMVIDEMVENPNSKDTGCQLSASNEMVDNNSGTQNSELGGNGTQDNSEETEIIHNEDKAINPENASDLNETKEEGEVEEEEFQIKIVNSESLTSRNNSLMEPPEDNADVQLVENPNSDCNDKAIDDIKLQDKETVPSSKKDDYLKLIKTDNPFSQEDLDDVFILMNDFEAALKLVQPSSKREGFVTVPDITWNDIGALAEIREELEVSILGPIKHPLAFKALGLDAPAGVLLCGPPGCGKTLLAKAVANEAGINFISVKGPELLNMYVGESERAIRQCFLRAKNSSPCVIFFDEIDSLCPKRSDTPESGSGSRIVNQLLTELDGMESRAGVFVMAATNRPDILDPAILRPGRLDKVLFVDLPTAQDRLDILKAVTKGGKKPCLSKDVDLEKVAQHPHCEHFTGADLAALVREASIAAFKDLVLNQKDDDKVLDSKNLEVCLRHFETAFLKTKPSVDSKDRNKYLIMRDHYSNTSHR